MGQTLNLTLDVHFHFTLRKVLFLPPLNIEGKWYTVRLNSYLIETVQKWLWARWVQSPQTSTFAIISVFSNNNNTVSQHYDAATRNSIHKANIVQNNQLISIYDQWGHVYWDIECWGRVKEWKISLLLMQSWYDLNIAWPIGIL